MNRNYLKLFVVTTTIFVSFLTFLSTRYEYSTTSSVCVLLSFIFALPIIMHCKFKIIKIKKQKLIYKIIMYILYSISFIILFLLVLEIIKSKNDIFINFDTFKIIFSNLLFMTTSWLMLFSSFIDIEKKETKLNFILNIIVLFVIITVHINYFINPNLKTIISETSVGEKAIYITQNYVYFGIMYVLLLINRFMEN